MHFLSTALKHWGAKSTKNCAPLHPLYAFKNHSPKEFQSPSMKILLAFQCFEDCFKFFWEGEQKCFVSHIDLLFFKLFHFKERMFLRLSHPWCEFLHLVCLTYSSVTLPLCRAPVLFQIELFIINQTVLLSSVSGQSGIWISCDGLVSFCYSWNVIGGAEFGVSVDCRYMVSQPGLATEHPSLDDCSFLPAAGLGREPEEQKSGRKPW